jgi:hypothetical protein
MKSQDKLSKVQLYTINLNEREKVLVEPEPSKPVHNPDEKKET